MKRFTTILALLIVIAAIAPTLSSTASVSQSQGAVEMIDLADYYPGPMAEEFYLVGTNRVSPEKGDLLWFDVLENGEFLQYNSFPTDEQCHWDLFAWEDDFLVHKLSHDECDGTVKETIFNPPVVFVDRYWKVSEIKPSGRPREGLSEVRHYVNGQLACVGMNQWNGWGYSTGHDGDSVQVFFRVDQSLVFLMGSECYDGEWTLVNLFGEFPDGTKGMTVSDGGQLVNREPYEQDTPWWTIYFHGWLPLPWTA